MKKLLGILLVLALVLSFSLVATTPVAAATHSVGPGESIQAAIDAAEPGDTIEVAAGTYVEQLIIDKMLDLRGPHYGVSATDASRGAGEAVLTFPPGLAEFSYMIAVGAEDVSIDGFTLDGQALDATFDGVGVFADESNLTVKNNVVKNFTNSGVWTTSYKYIDDNWDRSYYNIGLLVENNLFTSDVEGYYYDRSGIYVQGDNGNVKGNVVDSARTGIQVQPYNNPESTQGLVEGNILKAFWSPLWFNCSENTAVDWLFKDNTVEAIPWPEGAELRYVEEQTYVGLLVTSFEAGSVSFDENTVNIGATDASKIYMFQDIGNYGGTIDLEATFANNTFERAVVVRGSAIKVPIIFSTIEDALEAAEPGDTIEVKAGTYVGYDPLLDVEITEASISIGADASASTTSVSAEATGGDDDTIVAVAEFVGNPSGVSPGFRSGAVYIDVHVSGTLPEELVVEIACPGSCSGVELQWWDGTEWQAVVAPTSVVNGKIQVVLSATSSPTIEDLWSTPFGLGSLSTVGWEGSSVNKVAVVAPWIALLATIMAGAGLLVLRRRLTQN